MDPDTLDWLPAHGAPQQLMLLLHGVGANAAAMAPLARALRLAFPQAALVARDAPHPFDGGDAAPPGQAAGGAFQWFSIRGIDEANRPARVAAAVEALVPWVRAQQQRLSVGAPATCLVGFSQGAILALAAVQAHDGIAGRVLAFAGRYAVLPDVAPQLSTLHFLHGGADPVVPARHARDAIERLGQLGGDATMDVAEGIGHVLHPALVDCAIHRLQSHVPLRTWREAMGAAPQGRPAP